MKFTPFRAVSTLSTKRLNVRVTETQEINFHQIIVLSVLEAPREICSRHIQDTTAKQTHLEAVMMFSRHVPR